MAILVNTILDLFWISAMVTGVLYVTFLTVESYRARMYYKAMTVFAVLYMVTAGWAMYTIHTMIY